METNNVSSTLFILSVTGNLWLITFYFIRFGMFHAFFQILNLS